LKPYLKNLPVAVPGANEPAVLFGDWGRAEKLAKDIIDVSRHVNSLSVDIHVFISLHDTMYYIVKPI
jgi:hypothetical protein